MKNIKQNRQFLINRLGQLRNRAGLSARELSGQMGKSDAYIAKFENGDFSIPVEVLFDAVEICNSSMEEFFWSDIEKYSEQKQLLSIYESLSDESKKVLWNLIKNLK